MAQYPSYLMNNYPQYQMPMYQQQFQQNQIANQAYMDRMAQLQAMQQSLQTPQIPAAASIGLNGRIVEDFNVITANDVPMDGNGAIFIKNDCSEIQIRNWTAQGTIVTSRFKPVLEEQAINSPQAEEKLKIDLSDEATEVFMRRFDDIESRFDRLEKSMIKQPTSRNKKEGVAEDE